MQTDESWQPIDSLGQYLVAARRAAGLTMRQLGELSGIPRATISRLENNAVDQPAVKSLLALAQVLELNDADLLLRAGLTVPRTPVSLDVMLRTAYNLPPEAVAEATQQVQAIVKKYDRSQ